MNSTRPQWAKMHRYAAKMKRAHDLIFRYIAGARVKKRRLKKWNRSSHRAWKQVLKSVGIWSGRNKAIR